MKTIRFRAGTCCWASAGLLLWMCGAAGGAKNPAAQLEYEVRSDHMTSFTQRDEWLASQAQDKGDNSLRKALGKKRLERGNLMEQYGMTWKEAEAYQVYKEYRQLRNETAQQRGFAKDERNEASDDVYQGAGSYGNSQYKDAAAQNVNAAESRARDCYNQSRQLDQMWRAAGYDRVYGPLTDSDQYPIQRTDGTRTDLVESKLFQNRLDPDDQKYTDWVRSRPDDLANAIRNLPPGEYSDQLKQQWELGEYRRVVEGLKIMEEVGEFKTLKDENGNYLAGTLAGESAKYAAEKRGQEGDPEVASDEESPAEEETAETESDDSSGDDKVEAPETPDEGAAGAVAADSTASGEDAAAGTATDSLVPPGTATEPETDAETETDENLAPEEPEVATGRDREPQSGTDDGISEGDDSSPPGEADDQETESDDDGEAEDSDSAPEGAADADRPGETTTSSGYVEDSKGGRITLTETRGADGSLIRTGSTETDKDGNVISQTTYEGGTGEGKATRGGDLRGSEAGSGADVGPEAVGGGVNTAESFAGNWTQSQGQRGTDGSMTMAQNTQMGEAANAGNQGIRDAGAIRDAGGRDAGVIRDASTRATTKSDRDNSWGKALGDAVESGITEGGKAFGGALGGAAADKAVGEIFGPSDSDSGSGEGSATTEEGSGETTAANDEPGKGSSEGDDDDDDDDDDGDSKDGCDDDCGAGGSPGGSKPADDPLGVTGSTKNEDGSVTIRYGCGYSWTGKPPGPSRCPICSRETVSTETTPPPSTGDASGAGATAGSGGTTGPAGPADPTLEPPTGGDDYDSGPVLPPVEPTPPGLQGPTDEPTEEFN